MRVAGVGQLGDSEVDQLDEIGAAGLVDEEDVVRFEVPVDDSAVVGRLQRAAALKENRSHALERKRRSGLHERLQRPPLQEFHDEVVPAAVRDVEIENVDDVLVADDVHGLCLVEEPLDDPFIRVEAGMEHLDRHLRADGGVLAHVHGAHAAFAQDLDDPPGADLPSDHLVSSSLLRGNGPVLRLALGRAPVSRIRHDRQAG